MGSQYARVLAVLDGSSEPLALFEIKSKIEQQFFKIDSEAAISARIRGIRRDLELQCTGTVNTMRVPDKAWCRYSVHRTPKPSNTVVAPA